MVVNTRSIKRTNRNADENPGLTSERLPIPFQEGGCPARLGWLSQVMNKQKHSLAACRKWYYKENSIVGPYDHDAFSERQLFRQSGHNLWHNEPLPRAIIHIYHSSHPVASTEGPLPQLLRRSVIRPSISPGVHGTPPQAVPSPPSHGLLLDQLPR